MRITRLLIILLSGTILFSFQLERRKSRDFYILFGSGFKNDTVSLEINGNRIMSKTILDSDTISGLGNQASIHSRNDTLLLLDSRLNVVNKIPFQYGNKLRFVLTINDRPYDLLADLKKGRFIIISKHKYYYNVYLNQYRKPVSFE